MKTLSQIEKKAGKIIGELQILGGVERKKIQLRKKFLNDIDIEKEWNDYE